MAALAGMLALEEPSGPRWSDFLDGTGKIDFQGFLCLMREMAGLQYPRLRLDPEVALRTVSEAEPGCPQEQSGRLDAMLAEAFPLMLPVPCSCSSRS